MKRLAAATLLALAGTAFASPQLAQSAGCNACHLPDKKLVGPSYKDIAARYKGNANAPALLAEKVRKGGKGVWGETPMMATDKSRLNDADLKTVVAWILKF